MYKRIVMICNFSERGDQGIQNLLDNYQAPFVQTHLYEYNDKACSPKITPSNPYLYLGQDSVSAKPIRNWRVLLISDGLETKNYPNDIFDPDTLVMYHTVPSKMANFLDNKNISSKKQGYHEPGEENGYPLINRLVAAYETDGKFKGTEFYDAVDRLIEWFGVNEVLEAKLNLLHDCLDKVPSSLDNLLKTEYGASFDDFRRKATGKRWPDQEYIDALTELRQSLLSS